METVGQMTAISESNIALIPLNLCPPWSPLDCQVSHVVSNNAAHPASPVKTTNKLKLTKSSLSYIYIYIYIYIERERESSFELRI